MKHGLSEAAAKERQRLARQMSSALLGPIAGKMPKSSVESLEKLSYRQEIRKHIDRIVPMTQAEVVRHEPGLEVPPFIRTEAAFARRNLYLLNDAVVSPHSGMVWIENRILEESVGSLRRIMDWGDVLHEPLLPVRELPLSDPVVVCHPASYYHWLLEVLPNLLCAVFHFPGVKILTPEACPQYVLQGLGAVLGADAAERLVPCQGPVRVASLVMPQYHAVPEFTHPETLALLRDHVKAKVVEEGAPSAAGSAGKKIYISRRKGKKRRLVGEHLLEEMLADRGVTVLHCEELSFSEQVRIFHQADTVIATHGAGLSNLVWCQPPCRVIEIFPNNYILDCFAWLSFSLGLAYRHVVCETGHRLDEGALAAVLDLLDSPLAPAGKMWRSAIVQTGVKGDAGDGRDRCTISWAEPRSPWAF